MKGWSIFFIIAISLSTFLSAEDINGFPSLVTIIKFFFDKMDRFIIFTAYFFLSAAEIANFTFPKDPLPRLLIK